MSEAWTMILGRRENASEIDEIFLDGSCPCSVQASMRARSCCLVGSFFAEAGCGVVAVVAEVAEVAEVAVVVVDPKLTNGSEVDFVSRVAFLVLRARATFLALSGKLVADLE